MARLPAEDFVGQKVDDVSVTSGELANELAGGGVVAQRKRREVDARRPPLGSLDEVGQVRLAQLGGRDRVDELCNVAGCEAKLAHPYLDHVTACAQPPEREGRIRACDKDELECG